MTEMYDDSVDVPTPDTAFAHAYHAAEERRVQKERDKAARLLEALAAEPDAHFYDPCLDASDRPADRRMYEGTGIGLLYQIRGGEHLVPELRDWQIVPGSKKPTPLDVPLHALRQA